MSRGTEGQKEGNEDVGVSRVDFDCMLLPICSLRTRLFTKGIDDAYLEEERDLKRKTRRERERERESDGPCVLSCST
jgi:hypothetical protein